MNIYAKEDRSELSDSEAIESWEEAFMEGYTEDF